MKLFRHPCLRESCKNNSYKQVMKFLALDSIILLKLSSVGNMVYSDFFIDNLDGIETSLMCIC